MEVPPGENEKSSDDAPFVFQCAGCKTILGDTTAWVCTNETLKTITLHSVSKQVKVKNDLFTCTSPSTVDFGSSYNDLMCCGCDTTIGKLYHTTNQKLDSVRGHFSLLLHKLISYQIGSCTQTMRTSDIYEHMTLPSSFMQEMRVHMKKVQAIIVSINSRLSSVEKCLNDDDDQRDHT
ncbi:protein Mis18-alpha-like [Gigantopelta aegis]|uniref:protein Mis18-alpha-like n=1 Tax=Gigantopelta aegis TaxID=1735272 RepID=UPI001B88B868|nr:protein Mis18-alpha-like [Gigantopelta aegis]